MVNLTDADGEVVKSYTYDAFGVEKNIDDADTNAFRYCGEYYDAETGTIYLRARYYNPSTGRFISRDSYAGHTGEPLSLNLYTYCQNNPTIYCDPSGNIPVIALIAIVAVCAVTLTACGDSEESESQLHGPFNSADEAALDFAENIYSSSSYVRFEYATSIYAMTKNNSTSYYYAEPWSGNPHSVTVFKDAQPENSTLVAYAHTHPNSTSFSNADRQIADNNNIDAYMADPNFDLHLYNHSTKSESIVGQFVPKILTPDEMNDLQTEFQDDWNTHISSGSCPDGFNCPNMSWPNP